MLDDTIILSGHFGKGIQVFKPSFDLKIQYGYVNKDDGLMRIDWELEISPKNAVELATLLLIKQRE